MKYQACFPTPFAVLGILCAEDTVTGIDFLASDALPYPPHGSMAEAACSALKRYLKNPHCTFDLSLVPQGTPFQLRVWAALRLIPAGQTMTYAQLASLVGSGARAVANACGANPIPILIPCHRVVSVNGLGGFMRGREGASLDIKRWLLDHERSTSSAA
jgi:methylated-DNA-[protein]-cysteine S-methyltransferase